MQHKIQMMITLLLMMVALVACGDEEQPTLRVQMEEFKFSPTHWKAPAGAEVTVSVSNHSAVVHEWMILKRDYQALAPFDDADRAQVYWQVKLEHDQHGEFTFTVPNEPGEYQIICSMPGHLELGMTGTLIVTPRAEEIAAK